MITNFEKKEVLCIVRMKTQILKAIYVLIPK